MTPAPPAQEADLKALDQTRQRLQQLVTSLTSLRRDLDVADPLPSWPSMLATSSLIAHNLNALSAHLATNAPLLAAAHPYPLPGVFPGRAHEGVLQQLLRRKVEPQVGEWIEAGEKAGRVMEGSGGVGMDAEEEVLGAKRKQCEELWRWAAPRAGEIAQKVLVEGGARAGDEDEVEDEDDEDDADEDDGEDEDDEVTEVKAEEGDRMDVDGGVVRTANAQRGATAAVRMLPLEDICKFMSTGSLPTETRR